MPRIPSQELLRLAKTILARMASAGGEVAEDAPSFLRTSPVAPSSRLTPGGGIPPILERRVFQEETPALTTRLLPSEVRPGVSPKPDLPVEAEGPVLDAAQAMERVINKTIGFHPAVISDKYAPKVTSPPDWLAGKPGAKLPLEHLLTREDLTNAFTRLALKELKENPNRPINQLTGLIEKRLGRWVERSTARLANEPFGAAQRRRLIKKRSDIPGMTEDDAKVGAAKAWLEEHKLIEPPRIEGMRAKPSKEPGVVEEIGPDPHEMVDRPVILTPDQELMLREAGPEGSFDVNVGKVRTALQALAKAIHDPKVLSDRQRAILNMRLGLEGEEGMTTVDIAKELGITKQGAHKVIKDSLEKLRKHLEKAGVKFEASEVLDLPPEPQWVGKGARRVPASEGYAPRMAEELGSSGPARSSVLIDSRGNLVPRSRSFTEEVPVPPKGSTTAGQLFATRKELPAYAPQWAKREAENERLVSQLLSLVKTPSGKPLVPAKHLLPTERRWVTEPLVMKEGVRPSKPTQIKLPGSAPLKRSPVKSKEEIREGFRTNKPIKLVPDPNGPIFIGEQRYRAVKLQSQEVVDPKSPRGTKTIWVEVPE